MTILEINLTRDDDGGPYGVLNSLYVTVWRLKVGIGLISGGYNPEYHFGAEFYDRPRGRCWMLSVWRLRIGGMWSAQDQISIGEISAD